MMMDMGCHSCEIIRWMYDRPAVESVTAELATYAHGDRTDVDDHALVTIRFEGNRVGVVETSRARSGGMNDRIDIMGSAGASCVDLFGAPRRSCTAVSARAMR